MQFNKVGTISNDLKPNDMVVGSWTSKDQIPQKYWDKEENPEYDPENPESPEFIYTNTFEAQVELMPDGKFEFQADGTWLDLTTLEDNKTARYEQTNVDCEAYILAAYPITTQLSMASAIYPESVITPYREFVASCIEESNRVRDAILLATTQEELDAIQPTWPEVPTDA